MALRKPVAAISDRAKRYRARAAKPLRSACECRNPKHSNHLGSVLCGSKRFLVQGHKDGNESNGRPSNLVTLCKSCNTIDGKRDAREGRGVRTRQYNPKGAGNLAQYVQAAVDHTRGAHDAGGLVIHNTPKAKRKEFAREIQWRKGYTGNPRGRQPEELEVEDKDLHGDVGYEPHSKHSPEACANCEHFIGANPPRCQTVKSPISQKGWCERYDPKLAGQNPSDRVYKEWRAGKLKTSAGELVPRGPRGEKIARAILLSKLRREGRIPARMNPGDTTADELYTMFHGRGPDESYSLPVPCLDPYAAHPELAQIGLLTRLGVGEGVVKLGGDGGDEVIEATDGYFFHMIDFVKPSYASWVRWLENQPDDISQEDINRAKQFLRKSGCPDVAAAPPARSLFIAGGNQHLSDEQIEDLGCDPSKDVLDLGYCYFIDYFTQKRFDSFNPMNYWHHFGERSGEYPRAIYYRGAHVLQLVGGEYLVTRAGIEN
jgi:hypothetical protein